MIATLSQYAIAPEAMAKLLAKGVVRIVKPSPDELRRANYRYKNPHYHRDYLRRKRKQLRLQGLTTEGTPPQPGSRLKPFEKLV